MAFSATLLTNDTDTGSSITTASVSGTAGNAIVIIGGLDGAVSGTCFTGTPTYDSVSRFWVGVASGSAGAITMTGTIAGIAYSVIEITGGSSGIIQSATSSGTGTTGSATLASAVTSGNLTLANFVALGSAAITPKSGWTELRDVAFSPFGIPNRYEDQFKAAGETGASATWAGSQNWVAYTAEFGSGGGGGTTSIPLGMLPVGF